MNPVEEDRALDGEEQMLSSVRGREAMDPTTKHLIWIACGIGLLLLVLIGGWAFGGRGSGTIPVIQAQAGPVRIKPVNPGGMQALGTALPSSGPDGGTGRGSLAPAPETPRPDALRAEVDAARNQDMPQKLASPGPAPAPSMPHAIGPAPLVPHPAQKQAPVPNDTLLHTENTEGVTPAATRAVQLAALDSDSAARREWIRLSHAHPALFSGKRPVVLQADHDGHAIYRLRMRGFETPAAAASFCRQAHAERVACTVADF